VIAQSWQQLPVPRSRFVCSPSLPANPRSPTPTSFPSKPPPKPAIPALHDPPTPHHLAAEAVGAAVRRRRNPTMESSPAPYVDKSHFYAMIDYSINGKRTAPAPAPRNPSPHCSSPCLSLTASFPSFLLPPANPGSLESDLVQAIQDGDVDDLKGEYARAPTYSTRNAAVVSLRLQGVALACLQECIAPL
jgi:hypothetical protein